MLVNADFARPVAVATDQYRWVSSPQAGVERAMLDRVGAENARATSIVRYAAESRFPRHLHPGGEEILVLSGTFCDDTGDYPAGCYLRNPPGSSHRPFSREGAIIFVKLQQIPADETQHLRIDTRAATAWQRHGIREICPLFFSAAEHVCLQRLPARAPVFDAAVIGAELLVLRGEVIANGLCHRRGSWIRLPPGAYPAINAGADGATIYLKIARLPDTTASA